MPEVWRPGSFTKNFSWGRDSQGLAELHTIIRSGFADRLEDVPRQRFRERIRRSGRPDYIPINFFLFNRNIDGEDMICVDELVFQAISWGHNSNFDRVALFAFLFSHAGKWKGASEHQRYPAMWAKAYVKERVATAFNWERSKISADDIQSFLESDPRYQAATTRKLSTNLNYLLHIGQIQEFGKERLSQWWADCLFLALDRAVEDRLIDNQKVPAKEYAPLLKRSDFFELTGGKTMEKDLALKHLTRLYEALGGRSRYSNEAVLERSRTEAPQAPAELPNDPSPRGAVHLTNPRIMKTIPPICAALAGHAGFVVLPPDEMAEMQPKEFIHRATNSALAVLREKGIRPTLTAQELLKITRGEE